MTPRILLACLILSTCAAFAQPVVIKDLNTTSRGVTVKSWFKESGDYLYFTATYSDSQQELWRTDGTEAGTIRLSSALQLERPPVDIGNGIIIFPAKSKLSGSDADEIWRTDGTVEGTYKINYTLDNGTRMVVLSTVGLDGRAVILAYANSLPYIGYTDGSNSSIVFGKLTASGFVILLKIDNKAFVNMNNKVYVTDGTVAGTQVAITNQTIGSTFNVNGITYFKSFSTLWKTDGTTAGTVKIKDLGFADGLMYQFGDKLIVASPGGSGWWISDGTEANTTRIVDFFIGTAYGEYDGNFYAMAGSGVNHQSLYKTDGTTTLQSVFDLGEIVPQMKYENLPVVGGKLIVPYSTPSTGVELATFDGVNDPTIIKDINPGEASSISNSINSHAVYKNKLIFIADDGTHGLELWTTDGTTGGTQLLKDLFPKTLDGASSGAAVFEVDGTKFFIGRRASDPPPINVLFKVTEEPLDATEVYSGDGLWILGAVDGKLFLTDINHLYMSDKNGTITELFEFNNTQPAQYPTYNAGNNAWKMNGKYLFTFQTGDYGNRIWYSDATAAGTNVLDAPITISSQLIPLNESLAIVSGPGGLWRTDGTLAGTKVIQQHDPNFTGPSPFGMTVFDGIAYFTQDFTKSYYDIWRTDGTTEGTYTITDLKTQGYPRYYAMYKGFIYFATKNKNDQFEIWRTNGTPQGTEFVVNKFGVNYSVGQPEYLTTAGNRLYFTATDVDHGKELWVSDGTADGTEVIDLTPGAAGSDPKILKAVRGGIYFTINGELWRAGGEPFVKEKVSDEVSDMNYISDFDDVFYFNADSKQFGREFFRFVTEPFIGAKDDQTITFNLTDKKLEDETFELEATASSGLPVSFSTNSDNITINGTTATINKAGRVGVEARQAGNATYYETSVIKIICISPPKPTHIDGNGTVVLDTEEGLTWYKDGVALGSEPTTVGDYTVTTTVDGCASPMSDVIRIPGLGLEDEIRGLKVYPNPVKDLIYIESKSPATIQIITSTGQTMLRRNVQGNEQIHFSGTQGMYIMKISVGDKVVVKKFIKE